MFNIVLSYMESNVLKSFGEPGKGWTSELSSKTLMPPSEVARVLEKLAGKGLLTVSENVAELTPAGEEAKRMQNAQTRRSATSSQKVLLTDERTADAVETKQTTEELERSIDAAIKRLKQ